jgi:Spy/CpxP family protein refolding chaperone
MKRRFPIIALLVLACAAALADHGPSGPLPGPPPIDWIAEQLGLDETQKSEVKRILDETRARMDAAAKQSMAETDAELANVLTTEQLSEFKKLMKEARRHGPPPPDPSPSTNQ